MAQHVITSRVEPFWFILLWPGSFRCSCGFHMRGFGTKKQLARAIDGHLDEFRPKAFW